MSKQGAVLATKKSARRVLVEATTVGVDLGDQWSHYCILDEDGEITEEGRFRTSKSGVAKRFEDMDHARVAMEAGTHSIWISEQLKEYGHEVIVANVTELHAISRNDSRVTGPMQRSLQGMHDSIQEYCVRSTIERWSSNRH